MKKQQWQNEWPTEPGPWWLYGWCFRKFSIKEEKEEPKLHLVEVRKVQNGMMYVTEGHFLYEAEGAEGEWMKATLPAVPEGVKAR